MYNVHQNGRMYRNCTRTNIFMRQPTDRFFSYVAVIAELRKFFTNHKVSDYHILMNSISLISIVVTTATFCGVWWEKFCLKHSLLIHKCMVLQVSELSGISTQIGECCQGSSFMLDLLSKPNGKRCKFCKKIYKFWYSKNCTGISFITRATMLFFVYWRLHVFHKKW